MDFLELHESLNSSNRKPLLYDPRYRTIFILSAILLVLVLVKLVFRHYKGVIMKNNFLEISDEIKALPQKPSLVAAFFKDQTAILLEIAVFPSTLLKNGQFFKLITKIIETLNRSTEKISKTTNQEILKICFNEDQINNLKYDEDSTILDLLDIFENSSKPIISAKRAICLKTKPNIYLSTYVYPQLKAFDNILLGYQGGVAVFKVLYEELNLKFDNVCSDICKHVVKTGKMDKESLLETNLNDTEFKVGDTLRSNGLELVDYQHFDGFNNKNL